MHVCHDALIPLCTATISNSSIATTAITATATSLPSTTATQQQHAQQSSKESRSLTFTQFIAALDRIAAMLYPDVQTVVGAPPGLRAKQARLLALTENHLLVSTATASSSTTSSLSSSPTAVAAAAAAAKAVRAVRVGAERAAEREVAAATARLQGLARGAAGRRTAAAARVQCADRQVILCTTNLLTVDCCTAYACSHCDQCVLNQQRCKAAGN
jgi:hypothetical protein